MSRLLTQESPHRSSTDGYWLCVLKMWSSESEGGRKEGGKGGSARGMEGGREEGREGEREGVKGGREKGGKERQ